MSDDDLSDEDGHDGESQEVPDGAAVFPEIPAELGVDPLLLAALHSLVFLAGSDDDVVNAAAADEAVQQIAEYLQRLQGTQLDSVREDFETLTRFAREEKWPKQLVLALKTFLADCGVEDGNDGEGE